MSTLEQITPGGAAALSNTELTVSVVIPCLNEAESIQRVRAPRTLGVARRTATWVR